MSDLQDLYQELILDHNKRPRNRRRPQAPNRTGVGYNPLCGDRVTVFLKVENDVLEEVTFEGSGCAISTASASLMTESLRGKRVAEAEALAERFHRLVTGGGDGRCSDGQEPALGKLEAFSGVSRYPARVKCATLVWHTLRAALENRPGTVSTE